MSNPLKQPAAGDANRELDRRIDRLAASIQKFRIDAQRFFAGDLKLPPEDLREKIAAELRQLRGPSRRVGAAARFRLGTLEAQFQSHLDLFGRRLRERELIAAGPAAADEHRPPPDPERGVVVGPRADSAAVEALYNGLHQRNPKMDFERFRTYIHQQAEAIRAKTGCRDIQFRLAVQDGKMKLKAKPIRQSPA